MPEQKATAAKGELWAVSHKFGFAFKTKLTAVDEKLKFKTVNVWEVTKCLTSLMP